MAIALPQWCAISLNDFYRTANSTSAPGLHVLLASSLSIDTRFLTLLFLAPLDLKIMRTCIII